MEAFHCGFISIVGRPNVGKSTLLNKILGQKISITSKKPQTTRVRTLGIKTTDGRQCIYIDTPGIQSRHKGNMNTLMNREAINSLSHTDVVVFMVEAINWNDEDIEIMKKIKEVEVSVILAVNKIDHFDNRDDILPFIESLSLQHDYLEIVPLSAKKNQNIDRLEAIIIENLPEADIHFPEHQLSDKNERFFAGEFIREQLIRHLGDELPYKLTVTIEAFKIINKVIHINATVWVENAGQKKIIIGKDGIILKKAGTLARKEMEKMFGNRVYLQSWVKVKSNWTDNPGSLIEFGAYD